MKVGECREPGARKDPKGYVTLWFPVNRELAVERRNRLGPCGIVIHGNTPYLRIMEHRFVAERDGCTNWAGGSLPSGASVHHINGIKHDNRSGNLEVWVKGHPAGVRLAQCGVCNRMVAA